MDNSFLHSKRLLLVDDEQELLKMISDILKDAGFETVLTAMTVKEAILTAKEETPDLIVLDVMLPDGDGFSLMQQLRTFTNVPIIFLTAKDEAADKLSGLGLGADDYIVKPFEVEELIARVESVLRRAGKGGAKLQAFDVIMDTARSVKQNGLDVALTPREFDLLEQLMRNRGAALYRDVLFNRVWGGEMDSDTRTLDLHIQRLRKKLNWHNHIKTVYKVGYMLERE